MRQLDIFDIINDSIKDQIIDKLKHYDIDAIYEEIPHGTYTFLEIYKTLSSSNDFHKYLIDLEAELEKHLIKSFDSRSDFYNNVNYSTFTRRENCIYLYNCSTKSIGPIYCAKMIDEKVFEAQK